MGYEMAALHLMCPAASVNLQPKLAPSRGADPSSGGDTSDPGKRSAQANQADPSAHRADIERGCICMFFKHRYWKTLFLLSSFSHSPFMKPLVWLLYLAVAGTNRNRITGDLDTFDSPFVSTV